MSYSEASHRLLRSPTCLQVRLQVALIGIKMLPERRITTSQAFSFPHRFQDLSDRSKTSLKARLNSSAPLSRLPYLLQPWRKISDLTLLTRNSTASTSYPSSHRPSHSATTISLLVTCTSAKWPSKLWELHITITNIEWTTRSTDFCSPSNPSSEPPSISSTTSIFVQVAQMQLSLLFPTLAMIWKML